MGDSCFFCLCNREFLAHRMEDIDNVFASIKNLVDESRNKIYSAVNVEMLKLYWNIGKIIMEIQQGNERATYGETVLEKLSEKLTNEFGKGFSSRNLRTMRKFYLTFPIWKTVSSKLSWSHYLELIKIEEENKRNFYIIFASTYKLHLPSEEELVAAIEEEKVQFKLRE